MAPWFGTVILKPAHLDGRLHPGHRSVRQGGLYEPHHGAVHSAWWGRHRRGMQGKTMERKSKRAAAGKMSGCTDPVPRTQPCSCARDLSGAGDLALQNPTYPT